MLWKMKKALLKSRVKEASDRTRSRAERREEMVWEDAPNKQKTDDFARAKIGGFAKRVPLCIACRDYQEFLIMNRELSESAGTQFDPVLVDIFRKTKDQFDQIVLENES